MKAAVLLAAAAAAILAIVAARRDAATGGLPVLTGTVEARDTVVANEIGGRIVAAPVEEGQRVAEGDLLFALDDAELRLEVARLEARHATAVAEVEALEAGPQRPSVRGQRSRVEEAAVAVTQAQRDLERARALGDRHVATPAEIEAAALSLRSLQQRLETERQQLALVTAGAPPPEIAVARARAAEIVPELERARLRLARCRVTAPVAGVVTRREHEVGELVPAGAAVYTILDGDHLWVEIHVDARAHARLEVGQPVAVRAEAVPELPPFAGRVSFAGDRHAFTPRSVETRDDRALLTYRVKVDLERPPSAVKPGMFVTVAPAAP